MSLHDFADLVSEKIYELTGLEAVINENMKNNGVRLVSLNINSGDTNITPCIYMEDYYTRYLGGEDISEIVKDVIDVYETHKMESIDISWFTDWDKAKNNLKMQLVNFEKNYDCLNDMPHRKYLDLAIVYYVEMDGNNNNIGVGTVKVTNNHIKMWGVTEQDLYETALGNIGEMSFRTITSVMADMIGIDEADVPVSDADMPLYVLSNMSQMNGAAMLVDDKVLLEIGEKIGDYFVLPSSIHESLILSISDSEEKTISAEYLKNMVAEVNDTQVAENEILSYSVYIYSGGVLSIAA